MTIEQIIIFIFALIMLFVGVYLKKINAKILPEIALLSSVALVIIAGIDPKTLTKFTWKQNTQGQEVSFNRYVNSKEELKKIVHIDNTSNLSSSSEASKEKSANYRSLINSIKQRPYEIRSAADYLLLATNAKENEDYDAGFQYAYLGLSLKPQDKNIKARLESRLGTLFFHTGGYDMALKQYKKAIQTDPGFSWPYLNLGLLHMEKNDEHEAVRAFKKAIELTPNDAEAYFLYGKALKGIGDHAGAEQAYRKSIELDPNNADYQYKLGDLLRTKGDIEGSDQAFKRAIEIKPRDANLRFMIGSRLQLDGEYERAVRAFRKAIELKGDEPRMYRDLGYSLEKLGQLDEAEKAFRKTLELDPGDSFAEYGLETIEEDRRGQKK